MRKLIFFTLLIASSCGLKTSDKIDSEVVNKEIKARKIKRLKEGEIIEAAFNHGKRISQYLDDKISGDCGAINKTEISQADTSLLLNMDVACNLPSRPNKKEKMVWDAYKYNLEQGIALEDNIQKLGGDEILFSHPLILEDSASENKLMVLRLVLSKREVIRRF